MKLIARIIMLAVLMLPVSANSDVPGAVNFQGVLYDNSGQVVNGIVNFNFALFDADVGGAQLWTESQAGVDVVDGIYNVALGSVTPLTKEVLSGSSVYLEVSVDGEILSPRQRLLAVPYALKADEAESVAGISGIFIQQLFQNVDWDGQGIANDDPLEGVADIDGDGLANFIDPDNDGDGFLDDVEVSNGTGVNLVTPVITAITSGSGPYARAGEPNLVTITGSGFLSGLTVQVGTENVVPQNLTGSSFDVTVGSGQSTGVASVAVTNPNAEQATGMMYFYGKLVFVTSAEQPDAMHQQVSVADAFCGQAAVAAGLPGSYVAWYSDPANSLSVIDRFPVGGGPWTRLDGELVATDVADLTDGNINATISVDEYGNAVATNTVVATNTQVSGVFEPTSCTVSNPNSGYVGKTNSTAAGWTSSTYFGGCTASRRYYCFEE